MNLVLHVIPIYLTINCLFNNEILSTKCIRNNCEPTSFCSWVLLNQEYLSIKYLKSNCVSDNFNH